MSRCARSWSRASRRTGSWLRASGRGWAGRCAGASRPFALACATLLIVALAAPPLVLVARGVLAALASGPPVRGVLIRGVLSSITYGALTAPP